MASLALPLLSGLGGLLGGLFPSSQTTKTSSNSNSNFSENPQLNPQQSATENALLNAALAQLKGINPIALDQIRNSGLESINAAGQGLNANLQNALSARGLQYSPTAGSQMANVGNQIYGQQVNWNNNMPLLSQQYMTNALNNAMNIFRSTPYGIAGNQQGSSNSTSTTTGGGIGQGIAGGVSGAGSALALQAGLNGGFGNPSGPVDFSNAGSTGGIDTGSLISSVIGQNGPGGAPEVSNPVTGGGGGVFGSTPSLDAIGAGSSSPQNASPYVFKSPYSSAPTPQGIMQNQLTKSLGGAQ